MGGRRPGFWLDDCIVMGAGGHGGGGDRSVFAESTQSRGWKRVGLFGLGPCDLFDQRRKLALGHDHGHPKFGPLYLGLVAFSKPGTRAFPFRGRVGGRLR